MMTARGARDLGDAVEDGSDRSSFDGNYTNSTVSWLIGLGLEKGLRDEDLEILLDWTQRGHLAWVVIPN